MNVFDLLKSKPVAQPTKRIEQSVKIYRYGFMSTPFTDFQTDATKQAWNGWHIQSTSVMIGMFGLLELAVVYQREEGKVVVPISSEVEMKGIG